MDVPVTRPQSQPRMRTPVVDQRLEAGRAVAREIAELVSQRRAAGQGAVLGLAVMIVIMVMTEV